MQLARYLSAVQRAETMLAHVYRQMQQHHGDEPEISFTCGRFAGLSDDRLKRLQPFLDQHLQDLGDESGLENSRLGRLGESSLGLRHDLQDLCLLAEYVKTRWAMLQMAAQALEDRILLQVTTFCVIDAEDQIGWLRNRMKQPASRLAVVS